jgi:hypothetical protein
VTLNGILASGKGVLIGKARALPGADRDGMMAQVNMIAIPPDFQETL